MLASKALSIHDVSGPPDQSRKSGGVSSTGCCARRDGALERYVVKKQQDEGQVGSSALVVPGFVHPRLCFTWVSRDCILTWKKCLEEHQQQDGEEPEDITGWKA